MAYEERLETITVEAGADLSAAQHRFITLESTGQVIRADAAGEQAEGVLRNKPAAAGHAATVITGGTAKVIAGAALSKGDKIATDNQGRAITAVATNRVLGRALLPATAAGQVISVRLKLDGEPVA